MDEPGRTTNSEANLEPLSERLGKGLAVDIGFGVLLLIVFSIVGEFGAAFLITIVVLVVGYVAIRHYVRESNKVAPNETGERGGDV